MTTPLRVVEDADVPALPLLTGPDYRALLDALLEGTGGSVRSARVGQVRYVPGKSVTVQYEADVQAGGETTRRTFVAGSAPEAPPDVPQFTADGITVSVWAYPHDPYLPGLASATDPERVRELLSDLGAPTDRVRLRRRAYRAGRRAVIEAGGSSASIYLKVLRPTRVAALHSLHTAMAAALPVPHSLGSNEALGLVALQALPGRPLRNAIEAGSTRLPSPASLVRLLDSIPSVGQAAAPGPITRSADHSRLISSTMPELQERLERLAASVSAAPTDDEVPIHGDFHASQILVDGSQITGLVDVDTAGMGSRSDDFASLLAQLSTLALSSPQRGRLDAYGAALIAAFDRLVDPVGLRLRVAAAVVGFATGPFRVQMQRWPDETMARLRLAEQWAESSHAIR